MMGKVAQAAEDASAPQCAPSFTLRQGAIPQPDHKYDVAVVNVEQHAFLHMDDYLTIPFSQLFEKVRASFDDLDFGIVAPTVPLFLYHAVNATG